MLERKRSKGNPVLINFSPQAAIDKVIMENPLGHVTPRRGGIGHVMNVMFIHCL